MIIKMLVCQNYFSFYSNLPQSRILPLFSCLPKTFMIHPSHFIIGPKLLISVCQNSDKVFEAKLLIDNILIGRHTALRLLISYNIKSVDYSFKPCSNSFVVGEGQGFIFNFSVGGGMDRDAIATFKD